jgi:hypothetical protein
MEKLNQYREIIKEALQEIALMFPKENEIEVETIFDDTHGHYLLLTVGWQNNQREYASILHIDLKPTGKVYLQHDGTDLEFALRLFEKGIPKSDMVVAYRSEQQRKFLTDFAEA